MAQGVLTFLFITFIIEHTNPSVCLSLYLAVFGFDFEFTGDGSL